MGPDNRCTMTAEALSAPTSSFIRRPPGGLGAWAALFDLSTLPVLESSALALEELRQHEDEVDAHLLAETFAHDPLMTLKVLGHVARLRAHREGSDPETLTAALVMLGICPFFAAFGPQETVERTLGSVEGAMDGFRSVLLRSHRAARFALSFAVQRLDRDAAVIHDAALLHDFAELLVWLRAPDLAREIAHRQSQDSTLRSVTAQRAVLQLELPALQHELMVRWRLPRLLTEITDDHRETSSAQARNVLLAIRLARHTALDWNNAALADDVKDIASLLNLGYEPTLALLRDIDAES